MRAWFLITLLALAVGVLLGALTTVRVGAERSPAQQLDPRTFVFVRGVALDGRGQNIQGAHVRFTNRDGESWSFPLTNEGGWTKREVPDGLYDVTVSAEGWTRRPFRLWTPSRDRYPTRTFTVWMEAAE